MSATTLPASRTSAAADLPLERVATLLLFGFVGAVQFSIAVAQSLLALALLFWVVLLVRDRVRPTAPGFFVPLALYAGATLFSAAFSIDPGSSFVDCKQLLLFLVVPLVYHLGRGRHAKTIVDITLSVGALSAAYGVVQYGMLQYDHLGQRPQGALSHYMTYSGLLMLVLCAAVARLVFGSRDRIWPALVMPALVVALTLTFTRSAWVGACVAVSLLFILKDFRLTALLPVVIALVFALAPEGIAGRMVSMFDLHDPTNRDRLSMVRAGTAMVAAHPITGVGPDMVERVYPQYRQDDAVEASTSHLHNVPLQIAAERGIPALAAWLWFVGMLSWHLLRLFRHQRDRVLAATGLAATVAMLAAGLFEYNFGDSEFLMLLLVLVTIPFAAIRDDDAPAADRP
jgi:O-antigen ligase